MATALVLTALAACDAAENTKLAPADADPINEEGAANETAADEPADSAAAAPEPSLADTFAWPAPGSYARISTSKGDITVELYTDKAPKTVANFLQYAADGHYDRTIFHRVVKGFVVQGGGYGVSLTEREARPPIAYEGDNGLPNYRTSLAMARGKNPNSAAAQWYINLRDNNESLDHFVNDLGPRYGYTVFGRVIDGMEVADAIGLIPTGPAGPFEKEVPIEAVTINRVEPVDAPAVAAAVPAQ